MSVHSVAAPEIEDRFFDRELSWLAFNERVLELAEDTNLPSLERARYLAIFSDNLDEFFQVRVAGLKGQIAAGLSSGSSNEANPIRNLEVIRETLGPLLRRHDAAVRDEVVPDLALGGIRFLAWNELTEAEQSRLEVTFEEQMFPVLTPLAVDPGHPFPYISDLSINLAVVVRDRRNEEMRFARVKLPDSLPRFVPVSSDGRFIFLEDVIGAHLHWLFPGMEIVSKTTFRVTRNADLTLNADEAEDLLAAVEFELRKRRFGRAVRLELSRHAPESVHDLLLEGLELGPEDVYEFAGPIGLGDFAELYEGDYPHLKAPAYKPVTEPRLADENHLPVDFFKELRRGDVLVHHPYYSFSTSVEEFVRQASQDPHVLAIKLTLYRTSGDSPIVRSLIAAAESGKQVAVLIELKARFDEEANIQWARRLEQAGAHVAYGFLDRKIHAKTTLVVRNEDGKLRRYCHIGTGNYNTDTAVTYEDLGLLSANQEIGADLSQLFNFLTGYSSEVPYRRLIVAPPSLRSAIVDLIRNEVAAGPGKGGIRLKMNALIDPQIIEELYAASNAGIPVDLVVRGICCLRPGIVGLSENIKVRSIVGRYLEHSRIYYFANGNGLGEPAYYIGSPDLMPRNLDRRVEVLVPVDDQALRQRLDGILETLWEDDSQSWELTLSGEWARVSGPGKVNAQVKFQELANV